MAAAEPVWVGLTGSGPFGPPLSQFPPGSGRSAVAGAVAAMPQSRNIASLDAHATEQKAGDTSGALPPLSLRLSRACKDAAAAAGLSSTHGSTPLYLRPCGGGPRPQPAARRNRNKLHATFPQPERGRLCCRISNGISYNITKFTKRTTQYSQI